MMQEETLHIRNPFVNYVTNVHGWHVEKTHGSQFQEGFPDLYLMHRQYTSRWVETKKMRKGDFSFTSAQLHKFPIWLAHQTPIWIIYGEDFRGHKGSAGYLSMERAYQMLFKPCNCAYLLDPNSRRIMIR
jgi:hypothetical protein